MGQVIEIRFLGWKVLLKFFSKWCTLKVLNPISLSLFQNPKPTVIRGSITNYNSIKNYLVIYYFTTIFLQNAPFQAKCYARFCIKENKGRKQKKKKSISIYNMANSVKYMYSQSTTKSKKNNINFVNPQLTNTEVVFLE